ncbi:hypothetical protein FVB32_14740 [Flagellimonas hymeniacidonis]|uniref:DUF2946 domain-containing protein n=1 Tax=Flagellimonas hymeniacidonis TaxID=2603628 RepID=A0A5C8V4B3_9FLAO|nr:hypothetical protein [Flagellimonas hymeniacidonis]TXN35825.1 hypothetical protein FVB32_14740 [Flagellimonas hymeniacidonis]
MKTKNRHIWCSSILTGLLLLQLGYTIVHVLTSHVFHTVNEIDYGNETISETEYNCSLCAKLNTKPGVLPLVFKALFTTTIFSSVFTFKDTNISTVSFNFKYLRGPPFKY